MPSSAQPVPMASPVKGAPTTKRVVCTCKSSGCKDKTFINEYGISQTGRLIAYSTRFDHWTKDHLTQLNSENKRSDLAKQTEGNLKHDRNPRIGQPEITTSSQAIESDIHYTHRTLVLLICALASWLHLVCGLSRESTSQVLKFLDKLMSLALTLGSLRQQASSTESSFANIPHDTRTAISTLSLEPQIVRSICCPKCYTKYDLESLPQICLHRETTRSKQCGEKLWTTRSSSSGPRTVPRRLYNTQEFESWLEFFLSRPGIEDLIDRSYEHKPSPNEMSSIWDSPAWLSLGLFTTTRGNLTFSYFIDWFNPLTNKIAGKTISCGAIMMCCLNLPYELQNLEEYTYFAGITPPPKEPSVTTITALADPIIDCLEILWHGKVIQTHRHPDGIFKRVGVLPAIGDLLAMRKALGFAGIASKFHFCSFCKLPLAMRGDLDHTHWIHRNGPEVLAASEMWRKAETKKTRKELVAQFGVRYSSLHRLTYRDPVRHTVLGVMHNWIEGVLQHQARHKWGIGIIGSSSKGDDRLEIVTPPSSPTQTNWEMDVDLLNEELSTLEAESQLYHDTPSHFKRQRSEWSFVEAAPNPLEDAIEDEDFQPDDVSDSSASESDSARSPSDEPPPWKAACIFGSDSLFQIHDCLSHTVIPSWLVRPPTNLGNKSHGKLKADQWLVLFSVFLPLILPEIWSKSPQSSQDKQLLENFYCLVTCTNILCAGIVTTSSPDEYLRHYVRYQESSSILFPNLSVRPNHHYAMHNADLMRFWGPLMKLSEHGYERHNGRLQRIKTNQHLWQLDFTMLRQICRRGRLKAFTRDLGNESPGFLTTTLRLLLPHKGPENPNRSQSTLSPLEEICYNSSGSKLFDDIYVLLLHFMEEKFPSMEFRHYRHIPHPLGCVVLSPTAVPLRNLQHKERNYATFATHPGNSSIGYRTKAGMAAGFIISMWSQVIQGISYTFIVVAPHQQLSVEDEQRNPYRSYPGFLTALAYTDRGIQQAVIEQEQITGHVAFYYRLPGTFGITRATTVLIDSLHRFRSVSL